MLSLEHAQRSERKFKFRMPGMKCPLIDKGGFTSLVLCPKVQIRTSIQLTSFEPVKTRE